jgi:predicted nucleic acid-binding protein
MGSVVVDASVVLGLLDPRDGHHGSATRALKRARAAGDDIVLPASALAEVLVGASRLGPNAVRTSEAFVDAIVDEVHVIDRAVARSAALYRSSHKSLRLPDAFVLAVASTLSADAVLTADTRWAKVDRRVRVIT